MKWNDTKTVIGSVKISTDCDACIDVASKTVSQLGSKSLNGTEDVLH